MAIITSMASTASLRRVASDAICCGRSAVAGKRARSNAGVKLRSIDRGKSRLVVKKKCNDEGKSSF
jgi:hypothetical protein